MKPRLNIAFLIMYLNVSASYAIGICDGGVTDNDIGADAIWSGSEFSFQGAQDALIQISRDVAPALRAASPEATWKEHEILQNNMAKIQGVLTRQQVILAYASLRVAVLSGAPEEEIANAKKGLTVIKERYCMMLPELLEEASNKAIQRGQPPSSAAR